MPFSRGRSPTTDVDLYINGGPCAVTYRTVFQSYLKKTSFDSDGHCPIKLLKMVSPFKNVFYGLLIIL